MTPEERQMLAGLFDRVNAAGSNPRDPQAEAFINDAIRTAPFSPYVLAQTVLVQQHALEAAAHRIADLEAATAHAPQAGQEQGSFLGNLGRSIFGGGAPSAPPQPRPGYDPAYQQQPPQPPGYAPPPPSGYAPQRPGPWGGAPQPAPPYPQQGGGGGFLQNAASTAAGRGRRHGDRQPAWRPVFRPFRRRPVRRRFERGFVSAAASQAGTRRSTFSNPRRGTTTRASSIRPCRTTRASSTTCRSMTARAATATTTYKGPRRGCARVATAGCLTPVPMQPTPGIGAESAEGLRSSPWPRAEATAICARPFPTERFGALSPVGEPGQLSPSPVFASLAKSSV